MGSFFLTFLTLLSGFRGMKAGEKIFYESKRLCHHHHTFFLAKCDSIFNDFFRTPPFQPLCILLFFNLLKRFTARFLQVPIIRMYITVKMYPCSGGTDTGSPEL